MHDKIRKVMSAVFGIRPEEITENSSRDTLASWDSLKHLQLVVAIEEEFGIQFEDSEILEMTDFRKIAGILSRKS